MDPIEQIYDSALAELRHGKTIAEVVSIYPEHAAELQGLLELSAVGLSVPKNIVPTPLRRHKFAETRSWYHTFRFIKLGLMPMALIVMLFGSNTLVNATEQSLPNDYLYTLKRAGEQLQLTFTRDANKQANLQVEFTQRRLEELQQAVANDNPKQQAAALSELEDQSQKTFALVPQVAAAKALANKDSSLLDTLVAVNKQQKEVLTAMEVQPETQNLTDTALNTAKEHGEALANLVTTVQEQTLVDLKNKITLTGPATISSDKTRIVIDSTTFFIDKNTIITGIDGENLKPSELTGKPNATVTASKTSTGNMAKLVTLLVTEEQPATATEPDPTTPTPTTKPSTTQPTPNPEPETTPTQQPDQNEVTSGIIVEPPRR